MLSKPIITRESPSYFLTLLKTTQPENAELEQEGPMEVARELWNKSGDKSHLMKRNRPNIDSVET